MCAASTVAAAAARVVYTEWLEVPEGGMQKFEYSL